MAYPFKANPLWNGYLSISVAIVFADSARYSETKALPIKQRRYLAYPVPDIAKRVFRASRHHRVQSIDELIKILSKHQKRLLLINETNDFDLPENQESNPCAKCNRFSATRSRYEHACVRQATRLAIPAHKAAETAFMLGATELGHQRLSFGLSKSENEMPYAIIAGINEHAAVLHHHQLNAQPVDPRNTISHVFNTIIMLQI